ncbi:MAG: serpin family protein [Actinobacteria bacterium]|nr:serpin family protein [Actinomycetota bacterium]
MSASRCYVRPRVAIVLILLVLAASATGCSPDDQGQEVRGKTSLVAADLATLPPTVASVNAFGADLYRAYREQNRGNFVLAPYVIAYGLGMTRAGASAETLRQIDQVLRVAPGEDINRGFATLAQVLSTRNGERKTDVRKGRVEITAASTEWAPRGTKFNENYLDELRSFYDTGVRVVDFRSDPDAARNAMNNWARGVTNGNVAQLVPRGLLTDQASLVDVSTMAVQAPWEQPFQPDQPNATRFTTADGQVVTPRTMTTAANAALRFAQGEGWQAVELPFLGGQLSMVLVLPAAGTLDAFENQLTGDQLGTMFDGLQPSAFDVRVPKFQFETATLLDSELKALGMPAAFSSQDAELGSIAENESLSLSAVAHQSYIDVSENGTGTQKGSISVDQGTVQNAANAVRVTFDRPFLVLVRDRETDLLLTIGRVVSPNG